MSVCVWRKGRTDLFSCGIHSAELPAASETNRPGTGDHEGDNHLYT